MNLMKCDCGKCDCQICSIEIMKKRRPCTCTPDCKCPKCFGKNLATAGSMACCDHSSPHPPDCDCVDCLCEPCGSFPGDSKPRPHPPDCDCIECLCDSCGDMCESDSENESPEKSLAESLKEAREAQCREIMQDKIPFHPIDCDCVMCRCCECAAKKKEEEENEEDQDKGDSEPPPIPRKFPPAVCNCIECKCLIEGPPILIQQISIVQNLEKTDEQVSTEAHPPECDCGDCSLMCDTACPDPKVAPGGTLEKCEKIQKNVDQEGETMERQKDIDELRDLIKQIQCSCDKAEEQAAKACPGTNPFIAQAESYEETVSGLQLALSSLQDKCKQKDHMIAAMTKELKERADSKVFNDLLQKLAENNFDENDTPADFDRIEVCDTLPRPICDPKYGKPSNQVKEPLICQPCEHPDFPNCPCDVKPKKEAGCQCENCPMMQNKSSQGKESPRNSPGCPCGQKQNESSEPRKSVEFTEGKPNCSCAPNKDDPPLIPSISDKPGLHKTNAATCICKSKGRNCVCKSNAKSAASMPCQGIKKRKKSQPKCVCNDKIKSQHKANFLKTPKKSKTQQKSASCACKTKSTNTNPGCQPNNKKVEERSCSPCQDTNDEQETVIRECCLDASDSYKSPQNQSCCCQGSESNVRSPATSKSRPHKSVEGSKSCPIPTTRAPPPQNNCQCSLNDANNQTGPAPGEIIDSSPMEVVHIRRISPDSLLIKWKPPESKYVIGYEILIGGIIKSRVRSADRTSAVLHSLTIAEQVDIAIYALTTLSRCQPPALAIYQL